MGHSHYFEIANNANKDNYNRSKKIICEFVKWVIKNTDITLVGGSGKAGTKPRLGEHISFNGSPGLESFDLSVGVPSGFNFVKTNEKPYDPVIVACLILMKGEMQDDVIITSDGFGYSEYGQFFELEEGFRLLIDFLLDTQKIEKSDVERIIKLILEWFINDRSNAKTFPVSLENVMLLAHKPLVSVNLI